MTIGYLEMLSFVQSVLPTMRVTRQRNLVWTVLGILQVRDGHLTLSEIARAMPTKVAHWHKFKRIKRFLSNLKWAPQDHFGDLLRLVLTRFRMDSYVPVIIDQTTLAGRWEILWASIPFRGRALPIAFKLFCWADIRNDPEGSQNKLERQFLDQLLALFPDPQRVLLLFDRGYARVQLLEHLKSWRVRYVVRAKADTWVTYPHHYAGPIGQFSVQRGTLLWWPQVRCRQLHSHVCNLAITHNATSKEPWYLLTNLPRADSAVIWYERRFHCEELFKDVKDQLHLETIRINHRHRIERLLFALMMAYLALTLIGVAAQRAGYRKYVCKDRISPAWMALRLLYMPWLLKPRLLRRALLLYSWSLSFESG
jgi:hypothetical protein